jgi:hypothetical protein
VFASHLESIASPKKTTTAQRLQLHLHMRTTGRRSESMAGKSSLASNSFKCTPPSHSALNQERRCSTLRFPHLHQSGEALWSINQSCTKSSMCRHRVRSRRRHQNGEHSSNSELPASSTAATTTASPPPSIDDAGDVFAILLPYLQIDFDCKSSQILLPYQGAEHDCSLNGCSQGDAMGAEELGDL